MTRQFALAVFLVFELVQHANCCGAGAGGGSGSGNANNNNLAQTIFDIISYLPGDYGSMTESFILPFMNNVIHKVFDGDLKAEHFDSGSTGQAIACPSDLNCDMSKPCRWRNVKDEDLEYYKTTGKPKTSNLESYTGTTEQPDPPSLLTAGNNGSRAAWLVSDKVTKQPGNGYIQLRYWATPLMEIRVCTRNPGSSKLNGCSKPFVSANSAGPFKIPIDGPINDPFEIVIQVSNFIVKPGGLVIIDDIQYAADDFCGGKVSNEDPSTTQISTTLLSSQTPFETTGKTTTSQQQSSSSKKPKETEETRKPVTKDDSQELSKQIDCFSVENPQCNYELNGGGSSSGGKKGFRVQKGAFGNPLTGIRRDTEGTTEFKSEYLLADGGRSGQDSSDFMATSPEFTLSQPTKVQFHRLQASAKTTLKVCVNSDQNCPWRYTDFSRDWVQEEINLDPESLHLDSGNKAKLLFIAEGVQKYNYLAVAKIRVSPFSPASLTMVFQSDRQFKLRRAASIANVDMSDVHIPTHKVSTLVKVASVPDLSGNAAMINRRYAPRTSTYHYHKDNKLVDEYWWDRRYYQTPTNWPYQFFAGRRYNMIDSPYSLWWHYPSMHYYPQFRGQDYIRSYREQMEPLYWRKNRDVTHERPWYKFSYSTLKSDRPYGYDVMETDRALKMYKQKLIGYDTMEKYWLNPAYLERRSKEMGKNYESLLFPRYISSY